MPIYVNCPHCGNQASVSELDVGKILTCPHCNQQFHLSGRGDTNVPPAIRSREGPTPVPPPLLSVPSAAEIKRRIAGPAYGLILTGAGTTLMGLLFVPALLFPELVGQQAPIEPVEMVLSLLLMVATLTMGIVMLYGSIKMLRMESYRWAMAAAITAMLPCYCCFLGLPIGIWALIKLRDSTVQMAFDH